MHQLGSVPWSIRSDTPKELLFPGYIAVREGFHVPDTAAPASPVAAEWQAWWQTLLAHNFGTITLDVRHENPGITGIDYAREIGRRYRALYDPPTFTVLADRPALQALCLRYWRDFHREWETVGGNGLPFFEQVSECISAQRPDVLVRECVSATGKRLVPFTLSVDFLYWPEDYAQHLTATHIVLGKRFVTDAGALRQVLRAAIITALDAVD